MKKDWSAIHKLLDALKDIKDTEELQVYISVHGLRDAEIDSVMQKVPREYEKTEDISQEGNTGWMQAKCEFDKLGFKIIELTMFFHSYSRLKHSIRMKEKGGDKS